MCMRAHAVATLHKAHLREELRRSYTAFLSVSVIKHNPAKHVSAELRLHKTCMGTCIHTHLPFLKPLMVAAYHLLSVSHLAMTASPISWPPQFEVLLCSSDLTALDLKPVLPVDSIFSYYHTHAHTGIGSTN